MSYYLWYNRRVIVLHGWDVETMVVEVVLVDLQLLSALVSVPVCFFCLTLWDCLSQIFHTYDKLAWRVYP